MNISNKNDHANHPATSGGARDRPEDAFGSASDPLSAMRSSESQKLSLQTDECSPECLAANARQVSRLITRHFDRALKPHGLSSGQLSLLTAIETGCAQSVSELAASLSLDRTTLVRNLAVVEKKDWVRTDGSCVARGKAFCLTESGAEVLVQGRSAWALAEQVLRDRVGCERWSEATAALVELALILAD